MEISGSETTGPAPADVSEQMPSTGSQGGGAAGAETTTGIDYGSLDVSQIPSDVVSQHKDFRNLKSGFDRKLAILQRQLDEAQQQSRPDVVADRFRQVLGDRLDEGAQQDLQLFEMQQRLDHYERQSQLDQEQRARDEHIRTLSERYGVDPSDLHDASDPVAAFQAVAERKQAEVKAMQAKIAELEAKVSAATNANAHTPDLGGGTSPTPNDSVQQAYNVAVAKGEHTRADGIQRYADEKGIALDTTAIYKNQHSWAELASKV